MVDQRGEWQQRIHAVVYRHGLPRRRGGLLTADGRAWLAEVALGAAAREQVTVALGMIDALDASFPRSTSNCATTRAANRGTGR